MDGASRLRENYVGTLEIRGSHVWHNSKTLPQDAQKDCPARPFQFSLPLFRGVAKAALDCANRTSTVSSCAFCEQRGHLAAPCSSFSSRALREHGDRPNYPTSIFSILLEEGQRLMTISRATLPLGPKGF